MSFTLVAYDELKRNIRESVNTLIRSHDFNPSKLEESLNKIPDERRIQAMFLLITIGLLDIGFLDILDNPLENPLDKPIDQARILNAAAYYIRDQIGQSYSYRAPNKSTFYNSLTTSLGLNKENKPERDDLAEMYGSLEKFLCKSVYKFADPKKGYLNVQPFNIEGYEVEKDIIILSTKVNMYKVELIQQLKEMRQKELEARKPVAPSRGLLGIFGGSSPAPKVVASTPAPKAESKQNAPLPSEESKDELNKKAPAPQEELKGELKKKTPAPPEESKDELNKKAPVPQEESTDESKEKALAPAF